MTNGSAADARIRLVLLLGVAALVLAACSSAPRVPPAARAQAGGTATAADRAFVDRTVTRELRKAHAPGATLAIVQGGELIYAAGYGVDDRATGVAVDVERSLFRVGSISKLFTATAVMQLVEQDRLDLDADVNGYLQDFQIPATFGEDQPITLTHLLTHTAGFDPEQDPGDYFVDTSALLPLGVYLAQQMPDRIDPPGTVYNYCNYGVALAGYVVQQAAGLPYDTYMEQRVLGPLGMTRSSFRQPPPAGLIEDVASGYRFLRGAYVRQDEVYFNGGPAGSLVATAPDMARFMIAQLHGGRLGSARILRADSVQTMQRRHFDAGDGENRLGLAFFLDSFEGHATVSHSGGVQGFQSLLTLVPDADLGVFISWSNGDEDPSPIVDAILDHFLS